MLGEKPILQYAGSNVNLTISTECLNLMIMESGEVIESHKLYKELILALEMNHIVRYTGNCHVIQLCNYALCTY